MIFYYYVECIICFILEGDEEKIPNGNLRYSDFHQQLSGQIPDIDFSSDEEDNESNSRNEDIKPFVSAFVRDYIFLNSIR